MGEATDRTALLVTGMHRSGTSALTRMLALLGATLPEHLIAGRVEKQDRDYWESRAVVDLNQAILHASGTWWAGWQLVDTSQRPDRADLVEQVRAVVRAEYAGAPLIVIKDPRVSRLVPLWTDALEQEGYRCAHIVALRHPERVAASLQRRDGLIPKAAGLGWLAHTLDAERLTRGATRAVVSLDRLVEDWRTEADRLAAALGVDWPGWGAEVGVELDAFLDAGLAHRDTAPVPLGHGVHRVLERWAADEVNPADQPFLDQWQADMEPIRRAPSATAAIRRRGGDELAATGGWVATEHHGYNCEARGAWEWLRAARQSSEQRAELDRLRSGAGEPAVRSLLRRGADRLRRGTGHR